MPLSGEAKTKYQRDYMRRRRGGSTATPKPQQSKRESGKSREPQGDTAALQNRIEQLEAELAKRAPAGNQGELILDLEREISALRGALERERKRSAAAGPKAEKAPLPPDEARERRIKALQTRLRTLTDELAAERQMQRANGVMSFQTASVIAKALHPDRQPSEADRDVAFKAFTARKSDNVKARRR